MPKKSLKKKKAFKAACYAQAKRGMMHNAAGDFRPVDSFPDDGMRSGYKAGYRIG